MPNKFNNSEKNPFIFGFAGIENMGNTCYLNSALQCVSNIQPLTDYFLAKIHEEEINPKFNGEVSSAYGDFLQAQWLNDFVSIQPVQFYNLIWEIAPQFSVGDQHDSQEFLSFFLDSLHEELNRSKNEGTPKIIENIEENEENYAARIWKENLTFNCSVIVDLFQGQLKSTLNCLGCGYLSINFDPFMYLTLPIPNVNDVTLMSCLNEYIKEETLVRTDRWVCHSCGNKSRTKKKIDIWKFPPILILYLKRFRFTKKYQRKIDRQVSFPIDNLDLSKLDIGPQRYKPIYKLFAKIDHYGNYDNGHYTAQAKNWNNQQWYNFDDEIVQPISENEIINNNAYVLFYHNNSCSSYPTQSPTLPNLWPHCLTTNTSRKNSDDYMPENLCESTNFSFNSG